MRRHILARGSLHIDETTLPVLGRKKGKAHRGYAFGIMADPKCWGDSVPPAVFFKFSLKRNGRFAERMLSGFNGTVIADEFSGYKRFCNADARTRNEINMAFCHAHARRNFEKIFKKDGSPIATRVLEMYQDLYQVEDTIRGREPAIRVMVRLRDSQPLLDQMFEYLTEQRERTSARSPIGKAISYILDHSPQFSAYIHDGKIEIDNNPLERAIRRWTVTRRSSLFAGSLRGAISWSIIYSIIETCKLNDVDPFRYLVWYLRRKSSLGRSFEPEMHFPWDFRQSPEYDTFDPHELPLSRALKTQLKAANAVVDAV